MKVFGAYPYIPAVFDCIHGVELHGDEQGLLGDGVPREEDSGQGWRRHGGRDHVRRKAQGDRLPNPTQNRPLVEKCQFKNYYTGRKNGVILT